MNKPLLEELLQLSPAVRIELAQELSDSAGAEDLPPLSPEQMRKIDRRLDEDEKNPSSAIPWEEVRTWLGSRRK